MKKLLFMAFAVAMLVGCYDDSAIVSRLSSVEGAVQEIDLLLDRLSQLEDNVYVISVTETDSGYVLSLSNSQQITINHGAAGKDATAPTVMVENNEVVITCGTQTVRIPYRPVFSLNISSESIPVVAGSTAEVPYTLTGADESTVVYVMADGGYSATVAHESVSEGVIVVGVPASYSDGKVVVFAGNNSQAAMAVLSFEEGMVTITENEFTIAKEGGNIEIPVSANLEYSVVIPEDAAWLSYVQTKAMRNETVVLSAAANESYPRKAKVELKVGDKTFCTFEVSQKGAIEVPYTADDLIGTWTVTCTNGSSPATFDMSIVKSDDSAKGDVILKRWFKPNSTTETTIYASVDNIANTLTIPSQQLPYSGYYSAWTAAQNSAGTIYTVVFTIAEDGASMTIDEDLKLGDTWYQNSGSFTSYYYYAFELNKKDE